MRLHQQKQKKIRKRKKKHVDKYRKSTKVHPKKTKKKSIDTQQSFVSKMQSMYKNNKWVSRGVFVGKCATYLGFSVLGLFL